MCNQLNQLKNAGTLDQSMNALAQQKGVPGRCYTALTSFYTNVLCAPVCANSPLLQGASGGRRLLGGPGTTQDPSSACSDPCFQPYMSGIVEVMGVMSEPACTSAVATSRRLLGGASMDKKTR